MADENPNPLLPHVARLHYIDGLTKQEIGTRLEISRFKVARLLDEAHERQIVRVEISDPLATDVELSDRLAEAFGLDLCVVVPEAADDSSLPRAAAAWLPEIVPDGEGLGVAWGTTLQRLLDFLPRLDGTRDVVQICGAIPSLQPGAGPTELAMRYAERFGGLSYTLPAPALTAPETRDELRDNDVIRPTLHEFDRVGAALVGIGRGTNFPEAPPQAVAHILVHLIDADGALIEQATDSAALAMSVPQLRKTRVVAVAGGDGKEEAILAALRSELLDVLFTDAARASYALEQAGR